MSLFELLKSDLKAARLQRKDLDTLTLSSIVGDLGGAAQMVNGAKVVSDELVITYLTKYVKNINESLGYQHSDELVHQRNIAGKYLPALMTTEQLKNVRLSTKWDNIGQFMSHLKTNYPGQYDGKAASEVWRTFS